MVNSRLDKVSVPKCSLGAKAWIEITAFERSRRSMHQPDVAVCANRQTLSNAVIGNVGFGTLAQPR
jgi:hypothetical protein